MERWYNRIAVVTSACSCLGQAVVKDLVRVGVVVAALARQPDRLDALRNALPQDQQLRFYARVCDATITEEISAAFDWIDQTLGGVDILIHNAGVRTPGAIFARDFSDINAIVEPNVLGAIQCTQRAFRSMRMRNFDGHVILVNSLAGHRAMQHPACGIPEINIYGPSKYILMAIKELLRRVFLGCRTNLKITCMSPTFVNAEIDTESFQNLNILQPEDISDGILYALGTPPNVQVHEVNVTPSGEIC